MYEAVVVYFLAIPGRKLTKLELVCFIVQLGLLLTRIVERIPLVAVV